MRLQGSLRAVAMAAVVLLAAGAVVPFSSAPSGGTSARAPLPLGLVLPPEVAWLAPVEGFAAAADAGGPAPLPPRTVQASPLICILDTGIDPAHADLDGGKVVAWADFLHRRADPYDDNGHGTHVAAIAAGSGEAGPPGAAPFARLAVGKVMDAKGAGTTAAAARGVEWCANQGALVINLSLEEKDCQPQNAIADAVARATRLGVLVVTTAGNRGAATCAIHSPGTLTQALTVGATDGASLGADGVASFSGRGAPGSVKPDLLGPGTGIRAARAGTHLGLKFMDGTSMAAPYVAGVAALLREAHPAATPEAVGEALRRTARDQGPAGFDTAFGWGTVDPAAALAWLDAAMARGA